MCMKDAYVKITENMDKLADVPLLLLRVILAYTFYGPAMTKLSDISATAEFFAYLGIPFATLNAYMAAGTELIGAVLILAGFMTRLVSVPLLFIMLVAVLTVHGSHGFHVIAPYSSWENPYINGELVEHTVVVLQNGYEMVLYYSAMLMVLLTQGAGRLSIDHLVFKRS